MIDIISRVRLIVYMVDNILKVCGLLKRMEMFYSESEIFPKGKNNVSQEMPAYPHGR